ncbi:MAG: GNAT family N-acetyltransferase, partial [Nitratireductor sp.]
YYKRLWCDLETIQFDTFVPLTAKGRAAALTRAGIARAKRLINNNPRLWATAKAVRRRLALLRG